MVCFSCLIIMFYESLIVFILLSYADQVHSLILQRSYSQRKTHFGQFTSSIQTKYMVDFGVQIPAAFDPFAEAQEESAAPGLKEYVHIRIQQRNGKKSLTTLQGLKKAYSYEKILKDLKKEFCCNGNVIQDKELGKVIQLQGDQRKKVANFLVQAGLVPKEQIKIHGF